MAATTTFEGHHQRAADTSVPQVREWLVLAAVTAITAGALGLGVAAAASHPDVDAGAPQQELVGWGD